MENLQKKKSILWRIYKKAGVKINTSQAADAHVAFIWNAFVVVRHFFYTWNTADSSGTKPFDIYELKAVSVGYNASEKYKYDTIYVWKEFWLATDENATKVVAE